MIKHLVLLLQTEYNNITKHYRYSVLNLLLVLIIKLLFVVVH